MKKIGMMSMQRVANYGSFLQAFGLKKIIEEISGEKVDFIDFHTTEKKSKFSVIDFINRIKLRVKLILCFIGFKYLRKENLQKEVKAITYLYKFNKLFNKRFQKEFWPILGLGSTKYDDGLDMLIIGSDEVFNYFSNEDAGYSRELIGIGNKTKKLISFSACCGYTTFEALKKPTRPR